MHARVLAGAIVGAVLFAPLASCGGLSSETPPPLEPTPDNVHYDRSATTLPGELGGVAPADGDAHPDDGKTPPGSSTPSSDGGR